ncbi:hypothetical protein VAEKB19_3290211 [Vibrio aestuarianus]|nr:hypothetical protein VAEKB19_3290211 [Vibrio aestuarianus]
MADPHPSQMHIYHVVNVKYARENVTLIVCPFCLFLLCIIKKLYRQNKLNKKR